MKKIKVNSTIANDIEKLLIDPYFDWYYNGSTSFEGKHLDSPDTFQFVHTFYGEDRDLISPYFKNVLRLIDSTGIKYTKIFRVKANFTTPSNSLKNNYQLIHTDRNQNNFVSFLYYVNDSDGDTIFFDKDENEFKRIKPKKGTGILFKSNINHSGSNPINSDKRIVINFILYE